MIEVNRISKVYSIKEREAGLKGALQSLFQNNYIIKKAVKDVSFQINQGEMVGYIGANGAGKSTTIKMLSGILHPTSGEIKINGIVPYIDRVKNAKNIGVVFGQRTQLFWDIPVRESYELLRHIYGVPKEDFNKNLTYFINKLDLNPLLGIPVRQLSLGQKMLCEIAAAFLHNPKVVFLDEPTIGLDIQVKSKIRQFIREINNELNTTVILTTHDMQDIEEICNRIIILDEGEVIYDGDSESIKNYLSEQRVVHFDIKDVRDISLPIELTNKITLEYQFLDPIYKVKLIFNNKEIDLSQVVSSMLKNFNVVDMVIANPTIEEFVKRKLERRPDLEEILGDNEGPN